MNVEQLKACGIDYDDGLRRFSGSTQLYEKYLKRLPELEIYDELKAAVLAGDTEAAFQASHKMKSFIGNLSIPHMYGEICELTDILRTGAPNEDAVAQHMGAIDSMYQDVAATVRKEMAGE